MKSKLLLAPLLCCFASITSAAGIYDGIYQIGSQQQWYSLHQNGNRIVAAHFVSDPNFPIAARFANDQTFGSGKLDYWNLFGGTLSGVTAVVSGELLFGACSMTAEMNFGVAGIVTVTATSIVTTVVGSDQGINCGGAAAAAGLDRFTLTKIF